MIENNAKKRPKVLKTYTLSLANPFGHNKTDYNQFQKPTRLVGQPVDLLFQAVKNPLKTHPLYVHILFLR